MKALPAVLLFVLLLPPCLFGQSGKPQTIIVPTGSLGEVSEVRIKILEKTLESKLDDYFDLVPKDLFEEAQEQAFQEMELEECTEEQCIMMIREILQVENSFQLVLMVDGGDTQVSLTWNDLDKKRVEEEYCEGCKTKELRESVGGLVERLIKAGQKQQATLTKRKRKIYSPEERAELLENIHSRLLKAQGLGLPMVRDPRVEQLVSTVFFGFDNSRLTKEFLGQLIKEAPTVLEELENRGDLILQIAGHTDEVEGNPEYSLALGLRRANTVHNLLKVYVTDPMSLRTISFGEKFPAIPDSNKEAWAKNRRVDFTFLLRQPIAVLRQKQESAGVWTESSTGKFRRIPGGSFRMGSPSSEEGRYDDERQHTVQVGEFWLGETEVTQAQWQAIMNNNPSHFKGDDLPVEEVSWNDIQEFIKKLNAHSGKRFRLPTETEWEYAARAGTQTAYYWGDGIGRNNANCDGCGSRWDNRQTAPVGSFQPNAFGLHDMLGNVREWTCSAYNASYNGSEQKCSVSTGTYPIRGGSWNSEPRWVRAANRGSYFPVGRSYGIGFRLVRD